MANHVSAEKRARQALKKQQRNRSERAQVHTAERSLREAISASAKPEELKKKLSQAFHVVQKAKKALHRNAIKRKMARLSKAVARLSKAAS